MVYYFMILNISELSMYTLNDPDCGAFVNYWPPLDGIGVVSWSWRLVLTMRGPWNEDENDEKVWNFKMFFPENAEQKYKY